MKNDLIWFLSEEFQFELKEKARKNSGVRFERVLFVYSKLFLAEFSKLESSDIVDPLKDCNLRDTTNLYNWADSVFAELKKHLDDFQNLFESLLYTYKLFLKGKHFHATLHLFDILEEHSIVDFMEPHELGLFYKGRTPKVDDNIQSPEFYYHIPYDMRYLVGNQRFSFSGQPMLYLGSSILDVLCELRKDINSYKELPIASFAFDSISNEQDNHTHPPFKIYDITNQINKLLYEKLARLEQHEFSDTANYIANEALSDSVKIFKKFILMHICTFRRTKEDSAFVEEYVIAQLLTEALRINNYHGIKFPSTRFNDLKIKSYMFSYSPAKENLALFTKYSESEKYDKELLERFIIQPLDKNIACESIEFYKERIDELLHTISLKSMIFYNNDISNQFEKACSSLLKMYKWEFVSKVNDEYYHKLPFSKLELKAQVDYLEHILHKLLEFENKIIINNI
nr:hypothetical protein [uncultured Marinifilum sp.]